MTSSIPRSLGVSIMGWMMIILAVIQIQQSFDITGLMEVYNKIYREPMGRIYYVITVPLLFAEVILGINVLQLKEWARKGVLNLITVYLLVTLMMSLPVSKNYFEYIQQTRSEFQVLTRKLWWKFFKRKAEFESRLAFASESQKRILGRAFEKEQRHHLATRFLSEFYMWLNIFVLMIKFILWYVVAAIFFTRPKVKSQFT